MKPTPSISDLKLMAARALFTGAVLLAGCGNPKPAPPAPPTPAKTSGAATGTNALAAAETNAVSSDTISTFEIVPCKGKDPFYPTSTRLCGGETPLVRNEGPAPAVVLPLEMNGVLSSGKNALVLINGRNFTTGEKGKVPVPPPPAAMTKMVLIQVLEIQNDRVRINAEGEAGPRWLQRKH